MLRGTVHIQSNDGIVSRAVRKRREIWQKPAKLNGMGLGSHTDVEQDYPLYDGSHKAQYQAHASLQGCEEEANKDHFTIDNLPFNKDRDLCR